MKKLIEDKKLLLFLLILIVLGLFLGFCYEMIYFDLLKKSNFEQDIVEKASLQDNTFEISKIILFSSADATQNEVINRANWNVNISQFCDIAICIDNHSESNGLSSKNTITSLYIDDIQFLETPSLGTPLLYYKNVDDFGKLSYSENNKIQDNLSYSIIPYEHEKDTSKPEIYDSSFSPICIGFVNQNIKTDYTISDISSPLTYDGSLLKKCNVVLSSISCKISFKLHLISQDNKHYISNITLDIPLKDSNSNKTIYDGNIQQELTDMKNFSFYLI